MDISGFKTKEKVPRESTIERYLVNQVKKLGGMCKKWPGTSGEPDRIVIWNGVVDFIELKRPGGKLSELQKLMHQDLRDHGARVYTISTKKEVDDYIEMLQGLVLLR